MQPIPQRVSLSGQVVEILRRELRRGRWPAQLPGETTLADLLQVSRSTLRAALGVLRREGLLQVAQGSRWRPAPGATARAPARSRTIVLVSSQPLHQQSWFSILITDELRRHLHRAGYELQVRFLPQTARRVAGRQAERLTAQTRAACWILSSCSQELQRWFQRRPEPALVLGSCHQGVTLPYLRLDVAAACRHAAGVLHRLGHRRIGLLLPRSPYAGAGEVEQALRAACAGRSAEPVVRYHEPGIRAIALAVDALRRSAARPTALIVMMPDDALTVLCHLLGRGCRLPGELSLVSLFDDLYLTRATPEPARYTCNPSGFVRRLARLAVRVARPGTPPPSVSVFPAFIPGATLGPPPAEA
ncbi:MAG: GntR family transcriptional regulator [Opitutaceae bacterium]|nr:GntR family transcriptional regulator [Opitutaceae bacterium]